MIIHIARKPLSEPNVASNVLEHGCGALNIDATRIATEDDCSRAMHLVKVTSWVSFGRKVGQMSWGPGSPLGRWPANLILGSKEAAEEMDGQSGISSTTPSVIGPSGEHRGSTYLIRGSQPHRVLLNDSGGASRYFKRTK